jgi:glutamine---fructose-6-phosphate transaminase (isomerizing)
MCGIVGVVAERDVVGSLIDGLKALEYRGYDSAGIALISGAELKRLRTKGKVKELADLQQLEPVNGFSGIAHTRWATHGVPNTRNAHPHTSRERVSVVHNGIIENHLQLKTELLAAGYAFSSDTDTEVIAHLIDQLLESGLSLLDAVRAAVLRFHGAYAIAVLSLNNPGHIVGARLGSPLVLGIGEGEHYLASDIHALLPLTKRFIYLEEGDIAEISVGSYRIINRQGEAVTRPIKESHFAADQIDKAGFKHFMLKEIHEQVQSVADTLEGRLAGGRILTQIFGPQARELLADTKRVKLIACGTSYHAACVARYWIEALARIPADAEIASEYRYREPVATENTLLITISQSGETADTLAALNMAKGLGYVATLAICNVPESSIVRASDLVLMTRAGPEIGVASTKAFTTQLTALALVALELARVNGMADARYLALVAELESLPGKINDALALEGEIKALAQRFVNKEHALFLGRGTMFPIAQEGALKLKEISYIHAEAYPAGELKHGPLALVDRDMPVIAVAPNNHLIEKLKSNIEEVRARGGELYVLADESAFGGMVRDDEHLIKLPTVGELIAPMVFTIPLQLLAYHVAVLRGTDVDQPRNLAKSVTVE